MARVLYSDVGRHVSVELEGEKKSTVAYRSDFLFVRSFYTYYSKLLWGITGDLRRNPSPLAGSSKRPAINGYGSHLKEHQPAASHHTSRRGRFPRVRALPRSMLKRR